MRREILVAAAILLDSRGRVLLVGNDWGRRGRVRYTLPGGTVEPGETAVEALVREVREETGLRVRSVEHLAYVIQVEDRRKNERTLAMAFRATYEGLLNPRDPDGHIVEARFFTLEEVEERLKGHLPSSEPLRAYLRGSGAGFTPTPAGTPRGSWSRYPTAAGSRGLTGGEAGALNLTLFCRRSFGSYIMPPWASGLRKARRSGRSWGLFGSS